MLGRVRATLFVFVREFERAQGGWGCQLKLLVIGRISLFGSSRSKSTCQRFPRHARICFSTAIIHRLDPLLD